MGCPSDYYFLCNSRLVLIECLGAEFFQNVIKMRLLVMPHPRPAVAALLLTAVITNREVKGEVTNTISGEYETFISDIREFTDEVGVGWGVTTPRREG